MIWFDPGHKYLSFITHPTKEIMQILGIKLVTGEEIIATTQPTSTGQLRVSRMVHIKLLPAQIQGGPPSLGFAPWPEYAEEGSSLLLEPLHIVYTYPVDKSILSEYNAMLGQETTSTKSIITG
jgi:hypothetical protein